VAGEPTQIALDAGWLKHLQAEFESPYMQNLRQFLLDEKNAGKVIFPAFKNIFNAFNATPLDKVKVVILGQDPYHGPNQAHGLCFSVNKGVTVPPSLMNIFKELQRDIGTSIPSHGCLQAWANQGVLLLNATLTVEQGRAGSHQGRGWEQLTDRAIEVVSEQCDGVVFMLWGSYAQKKAVIINEKKHWVLRAPHPSPLSAYRGFMGCSHFSIANQHLTGNAKTPIDWGV
jgi:uracil-DNA glycosylase